MLRNKKKGFDGFGLSKVRPPQAKPAVVFTHFYLYFDANGRIIHRQSLQTEAFPEGHHLQMKQYLETEMLRLHAVKAKSITILTALLNINPDLHFDTVDFCLACSELGLTEAETDVMRHLRLHKMDKEIAAALFISKSTASTHLKTITRKLGVRGRAKLVRKVEEKAKTYR